MSHDTCRSRVRPNVLSIRVVRSRHTMLGGTKRAEGRPCGVCTRGGGHQPWGAAAWGGPRWTQPTPAVGSPAGDEPCRRDRMRDVVAGCLLTRQSCGGFGGHEAATRR